MSDYNSDGVYLGMLEKHTYPDEGPETFYVCPVCGHEYLADFFFEEDGEIKCSECCTDLD